MFYRNSGTAPSTKVAPIAAVKAVDDDEESLPPLADNPFVPPADGRCLINDLPPELLAHVFELGSQEEEENDVEDPDEMDNSSCDSLSGCSAASCCGPSDRDLPFELMITRICRHWREVAISLPTLWTQLVFDDSSVYQLERNRGYLERAKGAPVDITIDVTFDEEDDDDENAALMDPESARSDSQRYRDFADILDLITPHVSHWRLFELAVGHYVLMQLALEALGDCASAPLLETLHLYHYADDPEDPEADFEPARYTQQPFILFHNNAPRLTHVALSGVHLNWSASTFLTGLHELELAYHAQNVRPTYQDFLRMLQASPQLVTLTICESGPAGVPGDWLYGLQNAPLENNGYDKQGCSTAYTVSSLQNFILAFVPPEYGIGLLERILMPNVRSLALEFEEGETDYASLLARLAVPVGGSKHSLLAGIESLKLSGLRSRTCDTVIEAGKALEKLKHLTINFDHVDFEWHELLAHPEKLHPVDASLNVLPGTTLFPKLEMVSVTGLEIEQIKDLVSARKAQGRPIKELFVNEECQLSEEDTKWLAENVEVFDLFEGSDGDVSMSDAELDDLDDDDFEDHEFDVMEGGDGDEDGEWTDED